jgi:hypothetical protein
MKFNILAFLIAILFSSITITQAQEFIHEDCDNLTKIRKILKDNPEEIKGEKKEEESFFSVEVFHLSTVKWNDLEGKVEKGYGGTSVNYTLVDGKPEAQAKRPYLLMGQFLKDCMPDNYKFREFEMAGLAEFHAYVHEDDAEKKTNWGQYKHPFTLLSKMSTGGTGDHVTLSVVQPD